MGKIENILFIALTLLVMLLAGFIVKNGQILNRTASGINNLEVREPGMRKVVCLTVSE